MSEIPEKIPIEKPSPKLIEGIDFYFEDGLMVLTEHFLKERGYCCGNGCRHCPYPKNTNSENLNTDLTE